MKKLGTLWKGLFVWRKRKGWVRYNLQNAALDGSCAEIISIDDQMPHVNIHTPDGNVHVIPFRVMFDFIEGKMEFEDLADWRVIMQTILADFMKPEE